MWSWCETRRRGHTCVAGSATNCRGAVQQRGPLAGSMRARLLGATAFAPLQLSRPLSNPACCRPRSAPTQWSALTDARLASGQQLVRNVLRQLPMCIHTLPVAEVGPGCHRTKTIHPCLRRLLSKGARCHSSRLHAVPSGGPAALSLQKLQHPAFPHLQACQQLPASIRYPSGGSAGSPSPGGLAAPPPEPLARMLLTSGNANAQKRNAGTGSRFCLLASCQAAQS